MSTLETSMHKPGILPRQLLQQAVEAGYVSAAKAFPDSAFQPASLDLRIGDIAYRLRAMFHAQHPVQTMIRKLATRTVQLDPEAGTILEDGHMYLIPIEEELALPPTLRGKVSPKSSIGRLDVGVRIVAEGSIMFDEIPPGYKGRLYALVTPRSFAIVVRPGISLAQLRLHTVAPDGSIGIVRDQELSALWDKYPLLYRPTSTPDAPRPIDYEHAVVEEGLFLSVDLHRPPNAPLAFTPHVLGDIVDLGRTRHYKSTAYWEAVFSDPTTSNAVNLRAKVFYLVRCRERLSIPPTLAAEMLPYDHRVGELRSHYAGFFDPGFGYKSDGSVLGSRAVLEIRAQEDFMVQHGHIICRLQFYRMVEEPDLLYGDTRLGSSYQQQRAPFGKHFALQESEETDDGEDLQLGFDI